MEESISDILIADKDGEISVDQLEDLLKSARWKVLFSDNFKSSFGELISPCVKKAVMHILLMIANGRCPKRCVDFPCESSLHTIKRFKVQDYNVLYTIDITKEWSYMQVLKVWDILATKEVPELMRHLDSIFAKYTDDFINRCSERFIDISIEGHLDVPKSWPISHNVVRYKSINNNNNFKDDSSTSYFENCKVSESLLLMKFYALSTGVVKHLLSAPDCRELDLPFEVTDEEREIILFPRSCFILGRSGTGKTTVLTMKLYRNMEQFGFASDRFSPNLRSDGTALHQIFVTVSPKLCYAVKQHVSRLRRFADGVQYYTDDTFIDMDGIDEMAKFQDIPDTFVGIQPQTYPLVVTFRKFLLMLDGTIGNSYFDRFYAVRGYSEENRSSRLISVQTFIRTKEVNYDRFCCFYWPHFNKKLIKNLDPSRVFAEIMSHIKGGLSMKDYVSLSDRQISTLSVEEREAMYSLYQDYEKRKTRRGEFDLSDLVEDLHSRLNYENLQGDKMDFVYVDEVQDLTMRQIALFRYICKNVDEGFVFCGDTAQTIAKGVDFRFEDTSLVYGEPPVLLDSGSDENALLTIFGGGENVDKKMVGFGAQQVILVRDDSAKREICNYIGHQALILTIAECKGLEFQDVLLYNFFGSSPLTRKWRVIYKFLREKDLLDSSFPESYPNFSQFRHRILCSELKQLYVAITRTRQRLWICENTEEFSKPMFDYWKTLCLVNVRKVDDSLAQAMKKASSPEEWKSQGIKLLGEKYYEMAIMCFERAGEPTWEKRAKATGLRAAADHLRGSNPIEACKMLREAAQIFCSIGKTDLAAECFRDLEEYEKADSTEVLFPRSNEISHGQITSVEENMIQSSGEVPSSSDDRGMTSVMAIMCFERAKEPVWQTRAKAASLKAAAGCVARTMLR
ncbi:uncharacterized protein Fot_54597 [Forsythia ovata]|uniref:UvrD-like helicase ATP-binding domain-containing protein n=1 Tax=Forsythia ovata TaxID=205694 RepID=A0ABD1P7K8_9LAMI